MWVLSNIEPTQAYLQPTSGNTLPALYSLGGTIFHIIHEIFFLFFL